MSTSEKRVQGRLDERGDGSASGPGTACAQAGSQGEEPVGGLKDIHCGQSMENETAVR